MGYQVSDLSPDLFWDLDKTKLSFRNNAVYIIERVAYLGKLEDWLIIRKIYGDERIRNVILQMRYLDEKSLNYYAEIFDLSPEDFRCYRLRQSGKTHFPF
jgi:hypothetical protein